MSKRRNKSYRRRIQECPSEVQILGSAETNNSKVFYTIFVSIRMGYRHIALKLVYDISYY